MTKATTTTTTAIGAITTQGNNSNDRAAAAAVDLEDEEEEHALLTTAVHNVVSRDNDTGSDDHCSEPGEELENHPPVVSTDNSSHHHEAPELVAESTTTSPEVEAEDQPLPIGDDGDNDDLLFDWHPLQLGENSLEDEDAFLDADLIAALGNLDITSGGGGGDDSNNSNIEPWEEINRCRPTHPTAATAGIETLPDLDDLLLLHLADFEELPEIDFTTITTDGTVVELDQDCDFLLPIEDHIFDYHDEGSESQPVNVFAGHYGGGTITGDTRDLLDMLGSLTVAENDNNNNSRDDFIRPENNPAAVYGDNLPPWFQYNPYCQPCDPSSLRLVDQEENGEFNNNNNNNDDEEVKRQEEEVAALVHDTTLPWLLSLDPYCQPCDLPGMDQEPGDERNSQDQEALEWEGLPDWLYCQPCDQPPLQPFLGLHREGDASHQQPFDPDFSDRDIDALLRILQYTLDDPDMTTTPPSPLLLGPPPPLQNPGDEMPEPETRSELTLQASQNGDEPPSSDPKDEEEEEETSAVYHDDDDDASPAVASEHSIPQISRRPAALRAAAPFLSTFDSELCTESTIRSRSCANTGDEAAAAADDDNTGDGKNKKLRSKSLKSERSCLGHRERIMGMDFSECGRFLATAAADSTIRIWGVAQNNLLATLKAHDDKHECLRVAWASSMWAQDRLPRSGGARSAIAAIAAAAAAAGSGTTTTGNITGDNTGNAGSDFNYLLATGGADGVVNLWGCSDPTDEAAWTVYETLDHSTYSHFQVPQDPNDKPQVYSIQFIDHWKALPSAMDDDANSFLMTSSDDHVHLWEVDNQKRAKSEDGSAQNKLHLREVFSLRFASVHSYGYGVSVGQVTGKGLMANSTATDASRNGALAGIGTSTNDYVFGGTDRNPQGLVFVFDACYCPANGLLGVALSDGSLRLVHGRGVCLSILQLPGVKAHLTSFAWDSSGRHLATSVATGHVITWGVEWQEEQQHSSSGETVSAADTRLDAGGCGTVLETTCLAVLEGGHERGRPLFGVQYCGTDENLLLSWGVDGKMCLWDAHSDIEQVQAPLATLLDKTSDYPIYCVRLSPISDDDDCIAVGGGSNGGFVGIPVHLYNVCHPVDRN